MVSEERQHSSVIEPDTRSLVDATSERDIPNLGLVKRQIREYYGDYIDADGRHQFSLASAWGREVAAVVARADRYLTARLDEGVVNPALVLDIDDTTLTTYPYLANTGFGNRQNREVLPPILPMRDLAVEAHARGVAIFFVSVRLEARRADTLANLRHAGYPPPADLYLLPTAPPFPAHMPSPECTPAEFKASTRAYIQSQGFRILASIGDQVSDLCGGHADTTFKLPNPMYYT